MTTNKPEVVAYATHHDEPMLFPNRKEAAAYCEDGEDPVALICLSDYEALQAECEHYKAALLEMTARSVSDKWRQSTANKELDQYLSVGIAQIEEELYRVRQDRDTHFGEVIRLQAECEKLQKAIRRLCNIYIVDDYYSGDLREERLNQAVERAIEKAIMKEKVHGR